MAEMPLKARVILRGMTHNPHFPDAGPLLAVLEQRRAAMEAANVACLSGGRWETAERKRCRKELDLVLDQLLGYVKSTSRGDVEIALSSGFCLRKPPIMLAPLGPVQKLRWESRPNSNWIELRWEPMHGARCYHVMLSLDGSDDPDSWRIVGTPSRAKMRLHDLEPGRYHWFKVRALSAAGMSPVSQVVRGMAY